jgi:DNA-binding NtrC family response regulator
MSRTPGRPTEPPEDEQMLAADEVSLAEIRRVMKDMALQLERIADGTETAKMRDISDKNLHVGIDQYDEAEYEGEVSSVVATTLRSLKSFRRNYDYWERAIAEYALREMKFTQRDTARMLGVGVSTINRWAQNPLEVQNYR